MVSKEPEIADKQYGLKDNGVSVFRSKRGLTSEIVEEISKIKGEPQWMLDFRLHALELFYKMPMPQWGGNLTGLKFDEMLYYVKSPDGTEKIWEVVPEEIKKLFSQYEDSEVEMGYMDGVSPQYESEVAYRDMQADLESMGVIFKDTDVALREHEALFKAHFSTVIPLEDHKFAALNAAIWSGGSFVYVPKGVQLDTPLQTVSQTNYLNKGQFERTLIIVDEGASVHYVESCTLSVYTKNSLRSAVIEIVVKKNAFCRYTAFQSWADDVCNLVTKRAVCDENATMEWIDGNIGSKLTMKYPACILRGEGAQGLSLSIAIVGKGQHQDAGAKMIHLAPNTSSTVISKSITKQGGKMTYRGVVHFGCEANGARSTIDCNTLIMDNASSSETIAHNEVLNDHVSLEHEAKVSKVSEEVLFYLMSRGISKQEAIETIVMGFVEPFTRDLPMEYAVEMNRLIAYEFKADC